MNNKISINFKLFFTFFKIGLFSFGGGAAMIPLIREEAVNRHEWASDDDIVDIVSLSESTPGPIAVNAATFLGKRVNGFWGAFCATLGVILPSFLIIYLIANVLRQFEEVEVVRFAFTGIRAGVLALIVRALLIMFSNVEKGSFSYILMGAAFLCVSFFHCNVLLVILLSALTGIVASWKTKKADKHQIPDEGRKR